MNSGRSGSCLKLFGMRSIFETHNKRNGYNLLDVYRAYLYYLVMLGCYLTTSRLELLFIVTRFGIVL